MLTDNQLREFFARLQSPEGCNFRKDKGEIVWKCNGKETRPLAKKILDDMSVTEESKEEFLKLCFDLGGYCDCQIVFSAMEPLSI